MSEVETTSTDFAAYLLWRGGEEDASGPWRVVHGADGSPRVQFRIAKVNPEWVDDFRADKEGVRRFAARRKLLLEIVHDVLMKGSQHD